MSLFNSLDKDNERFLTLDGVCTFLEITMNGEIKAELIRKMGKEVIAKFGRDDPKLKMRVLTRKDFDNFADDESLELKLTVHY